MALRVLLHTCDERATRSERIARLARPHRIVALLALAPCGLAASCSAPTTRVVLENDYSPSSGLIVYAAAWQAVSFPSPLPPGTSSDPQSTVPASANTAYVVLAPGWDPTSTATPTSLLLLESKVGYGVDLGDTLSIPLGDSTFAGNCASGSPLSQAEADFILQQEFPSVGAAAQYEAATCTTTSRGDAGAS
jgi:hypothetical protein